MIDLFSSLVRFRNMCQIRFKVLSNLLQIHFKLVSNSLQISFKFVSDWLQIIFKFASNSFQVNFKICFLSDLFLNVLQLAVENFSHLTICFIFASGAHQFAEKWSKVLWQSLSLHSKLDATPLWKGPFSFKLKEKLREWTWWDWNF